MKKILLLIVGMVALAACSKTYSVDDGSSIPQNQGYVADTSGGYVMPQDVIDNNGAGQCTVLCADVGVDAPTGAICTGPCPMATPIQPMPDQPIMMQPMPIPADVPVTTVNTCPPAPACHATPVAKPVVHKKAAVAPKKKAVVHKAVACEPAAPKKVVRRAIARPAVAARPAYIDQENVGPAAQFRVSSTEYYTVDSSAMRAQTAQTVKTVVVSAPTAVTTVAPTIMTTPAAPCVPCDAYGNPIVK
ncbi:MAG: hypothetical protein FWC51_04745 [Proteobacteria bacterium]|nr:hypothetical protein [Pseudomonadota bacterium]